MRLEIKKIQKLCEEYHVARGLCVCVRILRDRWRARLEIDAMNCVFRMIILRANTRKPAGYKHWSLSVVITPTWRAPIGVEKLSGVFNECHLTPISIIVNTEFPPKEQELKNKILNSCLKALDAFGETSILTWWIPTDIIYTNNKWKFGLYWLNWSCKKIMTEKILCWTKLCAFRCLRKN